MHQFRGIRSPTTDFAAVASDLQTPPLFVDVDLSTARSLAAGNALDLPINGNVLYVDQKADSGFATLHFNDDARVGNTPFTVFPGFVARVPYIKLIIENQAQPGQVMRLIYGVDIDFQPAVAAGVFGQVSVIDGAASRSASNQAFFAFATQPAVPAEYAHTQLWNPAASGKNFIVNSARVRHGTIGLVVYVRHSAGALTTLYTPGISKMLGGANSLGEGRNQSSPTNIGTFICSIIPDTVNDQLTVWPEPIVVRPGRGLIFECGAPNTAISMSLEYWEQGA